MAPFNVDFPLMKEWYKAFNLLCDLAQKYKIKVNLQKGDFLMYNNYKCFHARASFEGPRHMRGVYFEDEIFKKALIDN